MLENGAGARIIQALLGLSRIETTAHYTQVAAHMVARTQSPLAAIALQNKEAVYGILFRTAAEALQTIARDPKHLGAGIGLFAILHTWGPVVVPGGGLSPGDERWVACKPGFFLPVTVLSRLFRRLFLES